MNAIDSRSRIIVCATAAYQKRVRASGVNDIFLNAIKVKPSLEIILVSPNASEIRENVDDIKENIKAVDGKFEDPATQESLKNEAIGWYPGLSS